MPKETWERSENDLRTTWEWPALTWVWPKTDLRLTWVWPKTDLRLTWDWPENDLRLTWDWPETDLRLTWDRPMRDMRERWRFSALDKLVPDGHTEWLLGLLDGAKKVLFTEGLSSVPNRSVFCLTSKPVKRATLCDASLGKGLTIALL